MRESENAAASWCPTEASSPFRRPRPEDLLTGAEVFGRHNVTWPGVTSAMSSRQYRCEADFESMLALLSETYGIVRGPVCCTSSELEWWRFQESDPDAEIASAWLWEMPGGKLIAYAWPGGDEVDVAVHPHHERVRSDVMAWSETWRRDRAQGSTEPAVLRTSVVTTDAGAMSGLRERGYEPTESRRQWRLRPLDAEVPITLPSPGYVIDELRGPRELQAREDLAQHPFRTHLTRAGTYRPDLNLVARSAGGSLTAFCTAWLDEPNRLGVIEPLECLAEHRRRGLARAMMSEALARLRSLGATAAIITNNATNDPAAALYSSLGFERKGEIVRWERAL